MSTSLLYHAFGATAHDYLRTKYEDGAVHFHLETKADRLSCAECGSPAVTSKGRTKCVLRALPIGRRPVFLVLWLRVLLCATCRCVRQERRRLADPRKSYTRAFARYVLDLSREMSLSALADMLKVSWSVVREIVRGDLEHRAARLNLSEVRHIAIDEFAVRKGQRYATAVVDLESGQVLFSAEGRDHTCLKPFFDNLAEAGAKLEAIAVDMSGAYGKALELYAPGIPVVFDRFHVVARMNEGLDEFRRSEQNRLEAEGKRTLKGARYLLLRSKENLEMLPDKKARLDQLLAANEPLHKAYLLKEDLRLFWAQPDKGKASAFIDVWLQSARSIGSKIIDTIANTIEHHRDRILSWYDHHLSSGPLEGLNNKIKVLKRKAYGYRDMTFFLLRVLFIHEPGFRLSGV